MSNIEDIVLTFTQRTFGQLERFILHFYIAGHLFLHPCILHGRHAKDGQQQEEDQTDEQGHAALFLYDLHIPPHSSRLRNAATTE
ncbi:hypothetical protein D3C78_1785980 [compost metagenome]